MKLSDDVIRKIDRIVQQGLSAARVPGAGLAIVVGGKTVLTRAFGYRNRATRDPMTVDTAYPIASTSKAMNATLLGMLVDERRLEWDAPVQRYLPQFRLRDPVISPRVTVRDLVTMRTGLPRHDWVWVDSRDSRSRLVERAAQLELTADFRQRYQYCNLTVSIAGHIAEVVTGKSWERLVRERIFAPLGMRRTVCGRPQHANVTLSYHEDDRHRILKSWRYVADMIAPAGGSIYSTVLDMTRWLSFNLDGGRAGGRRLISPATLITLHTPQVVTGEQPQVGVPSDSSYGMGWNIDFYNGHRRLAHGGYLQHVTSSVMLFPALGIGLVCFVNLGLPRFSRIINQHVFDAMMGIPTTETFERQLAIYRAGAEERRKKSEAVRKVRGTRPSHPPSAYTGIYDHPGYGSFRVRHSGGTLFLCRNTLRLRLQHLHYDCWIPADADRWSIHEPPVFDRAHPIQFSSDAAGNIDSVSILLGPEGAPVSFRRVARFPRSSGSSS